MLHHSRATASMLSTSATPHVISPAPWFIHVSRGADVGWCRKKRALINAYGEVKAEDENKIQRSTVLIDKAGKIAAVWFPVRLSCYPEVAGRGGARAFAKGYILRERARAGGRKLVRASCRRRLRSLRGAFQGAHIWTVGQTAVRQTFASFRGEGVEE